MESAMEQGKYWMWARRKFACRNPYGDSWEEQAFAADAAGGLEGCTWPPRSYSCSFCRREFRSAQALGGHMNVHRRDRARLKASSPLPNPLGGGETDGAVQLLDFHLRQLPLACSSNPNREVVAASSQPLPPPLLCDDRTRSQRKRSFLSMEGPLDLKLGMDDSDPIKSRQLYIFEIEEEDGISLQGGKRQRSDSSVNKCNHIDPTISKDEIDLELRLGDGPKVK